MFNSIWKINSSALNHDLYLPFNLLTHSAKVWSSLEFRDKVWCFVIQPSLSWPGASQALAATILWREGAAQPVRPSLSLEEGSHRAVSQTSEEVMPVRWSWYRWSWFCNCWGDWKLDSLASMGRNCLCQGDSVLLVWCSQQTTAKRNPRRSTQGTHGNKLSFFGSGFPFFLYRSKRRNCHCQGEEALLIWCLQEPWQSGNQPETNREQEKARPFSSSKLEGSF